MTPDQRARVERLRDETCRVLRIGAPAGAAGRAVYALDQEDADALTALLAERELFQKKARDWNAEADRYLAQRDELTARVQQLEAALRNTGVHPASCPRGVGIGYYRPPRDARCDCGIDAALTPSETP